MLKLYDYWRSSASFRVRIALNHKQREYTQVPINLLEGEQLSSEYRNINPSCAVPFLIDGKQGFTQSLAIMEYLEETYPEPPLLPKGASQRAASRAMAQIVADDIHPIINLRVLKYITGEFGHSDDEKWQWYRHWIAEGFALLEHYAKENSANGKTCVGDEVSMADMCLIPQFYNARRFGCELDAYPTLLAIEAHCSSLPAFEKAMPPNQPDAQG